MWSDVLTLQSDVVSRLQPLVPFTLDQSGIADNLCKVEVFYEQFDYESIEESEAYPVIRRTRHFHIHVLLLLSSRAIQRHLYGSEISK